MDHFLIVAGLSLVTLSDPFVVRATYFKRTGIIHASYPQDLEAVEPEETGDPEGEMVEPESSEEGSQTSTRKILFYRS